MKKTGPVREAVARVAPGAVVMIGKTAEGVSVEEVLTATDARLIVDPTLRSWHRH